MNQDNEAYALADDMIIGADAIAWFLLKDRKKRRRIYYLAEKTKLPIFRFGSRIAARKSVLIAWIKSQEDDR